MMPHEVDSLEVEEVAIALSAIQDIHRHAWAPVAYLAATVINNRGMVKPPRTPVQPKKLLDDIFGSRVKALPDFWQRWERAEKLEQELIAARKRNART